MSPIDRHLVERKIAFLLNELSYLKGYEGVELGRDPDVTRQYAFCHSLQNAIAAITDICQHVVRAEGEQVPPSYAASIAHLAAIGILTPDFAANFSKVAKLRNVVVHLYENIDIEFLQSLLPKLQEDCAIFIASINNYLSKSKK